MKRRVAVTGMAGISPIGNDWPRVRTRLGEYRNAVKRMDEWSDYDGLQTLLGAPAAEFTLSERYTTKAMRSMGRVALLATRASELALVDAGLAGDPLVKSGHLGIAYGSSAGTPKAICDFGLMIERKKHQRHQRHHLHQNDGAYRAGQSRGFSWRHRPDHHDFERLHLRQPGHRLWL